MALETVVYPQETLGYGCKEFYNLGAGGGSWGGYEYYWGSEVLESKDLVGILNNNTEEGLHGNWGSPSSSVMQSFKDWHPNSSPEAGTGTDQVLPPDGTTVMEAPQAAAASTVRRKRRRIKSCKNKEELENQRMTHITVERNRRKQMNEYLAVIRSLMPPSYVQRGDQASIIGGAINFVKELEQHLQTLEAQKINTQQSNNGDSPLFSDFFTSPQYSTRPTQSNNISPATEGTTENQSTALADIEVTMVESHANLKILSERRPRQLLKIVAGLQSLWVTILHLNVTTVDQMVLYSLSVKLEDGCQLTTADEIADAVNHLLGRIQEAAALS